MSKIILTKQITRDHLTKLSLQEIKNKKLSSLEDTGKTLEDWCLELKNRMPGTGLDAILKQLQGLLKDDILSVKGKKVFLNPIVNEKIIAEMHRF